jgi:uncharacterized membrane protein
MIGRVLADAVIVVFGVIIVVVLFPARPVAVRARAAADRTLDALYVAASWIGDRVRARRAH